MEQLARLRLQLTAWYAGVLGLVLLVLGVGLFLTVRRQMARHLDVSLRAAAAALEQAARIRETERAAAHGAVVDAVDELHIPDRSLYLLDEDLHPIKPAVLPDWTREAIRQAARGEHPYRNLDAPDGRELRVYAERFTGTTGTSYVAAVVADRMELEDEYTSLIEAFAAAALAALVLVAGGGSILVRKSAAPVERSMEQMRRFMADAAHELRTPITLLRTRAEVAGSQEREPARDAATLQAIEREAARLGEIAGGLLTLARADAGEWPVVRETLYLDDAIAGAVDATRAYAEQRRVFVEVGSFEEAKIVGDPALVRRLLLIVLDNALKFTPAGGRVRLDVSAQNGRAAVVVSDTGIGIPPQHLPHVFERFYRGDQVRQDVAGGGAGLGLAIAQWIASVHGARIDVASQPGAGTRVSISFPLAAGA
ncbi:MAG TPA: HAMP domain-containing sensor histidine kinase [Gemmatimonadales bacterium]|jgi:signal transduction histidine kinase